MTKVEKLSNILKSLGKTSKQVAQYLQNENIKGEKGCGESCPIAQYLKRKYPKCKKTLVYDDTIMVVYESDTIKVEMPKVIGKFVESFDEGAYDFLQSK